MEERSGLAGLEFVGHAGGTEKAPIHRYSFPSQETQIRGGENLHNIGGAKFGKVEAISLEDCTVDIKKRQDTAGQHPEAVFTHELIKSKVLAESLVRIGEHVAANGMTGDGPYRPARDLLMLAGPRKIPRSSGEIAVWMRAHHERNLWLSEPDLNCRFHWICTAAKVVQRYAADPIGLTLLGRFAPHAGFVIPRRTFVCRSQN